MNEATKQITERILSLKDEKYGDFQRRLMPTVPPESVIGVQVPKLRALARELKNTDLARSFLADLPHLYYEENNLHSFLIEQIKDYGECITALNRFLPYVNNWATCDSMTPKVFSRHKAELFDEITQWLESDLTYTVRFGIGMLMRFFLDDDFRPEYLGLVAEIQSDEYYVNMMRAWYFATALAKQYNEALPYISEKKLDTFTHNKSIRKAIESYRITDEQKVSLRAMIIK